MDTRADPAEGQLLHRNAVWHPLHRIRRRTGGQPITHGQLTAVRQQLHAAIAPLDWLSGEHLTLATAGQGDLGRWLSRPEGVNHHHPGSLVRVRIR